ncbi:MAG: heme ABC exporter ATP-binding protein CcmA [Candidatus Latescibacterota bacterium]|nr:heme ABC exporter ATP-binding protein CcmA [Candidatus Latescibacterota bacterium]
MDVRFEAVTKQFGPTMALDGVDLRLNAGEHVLLAGANGAGKSTLLRLLTGLTGPSTGQVRIDGQDPRQSEAVRQHIGLLSHQILLYENLTAFENLSFFAQLYGLDLNIESTLQRVGLGAQAHFLVGGFSRGMKQRLALARATLHKPQLLLLDEPFTGLDRRAAHQLGQELAQRARQPDTMSVLVTHNVTEAAQIATRVVLLRRGRVVHEQGWQHDRASQELQDLCDRHLED